MYISLGLGDVNVAFPVDSVWEVIERGEIVPVPTSFDFIEGLRFHQDQPIPVYNLFRTKLFKGSPSESFDFILLLRYHDCDNGFLGTGVQALSKIPQIQEDNGLSSPLDKRLGKEYFIAEGKRHYLIDQHHLYRHLKIIDEALN